jgi:hypothetical protein
MTIVTTGLIADGSSDRALIPLLKLLLREHLTLPFEEPQFIDWDENDLSSKIRTALDRFSVDILFVHRDAENEDWVLRAEEIQKAIPANNSQNIVFVIPVKMTEAWLLTDVSAIRQAVGNPTSTVNLNLPKAKKIEACAAKEVLLAAITAAREYGPQRRRNFKPEQYRHRVAELTSDLKLLRQIPSFKRLEDSLRPLLEHLNESAKNLPIPTHVEI